MRGKRTALKACVINAIVLLFMLTAGSPGTVQAALEKPSNILDTKPREPQHLTVILERNYLDGEVSEEVIKEKIWSMEDFWVKYEQWQLEDMDGKKIVFKKQIDDISPLLKTNGYFGLSREGILTIYYGKPDHSKIIQSFFQIDIRKLESNKQAELQQGIPIKTKDRYVDVLESFKEYSTEAGTKN